MSDPAPQATVSPSPQTGHIRRVLTRWDLILFGLVILSPTAVYPVYGIIQSVSHGQAALSYIVAMVAMLFTAASYGRMATVYPSAGSTYTYVQQSFTPTVGFVAGWAMILDYFLIPLESVIYAALTAQRFVPAIPYFVWVLVFTAGITAINVKGIRILARANTVMMAAMTICAVLFIVLAVHYVELHYGKASLISPVGIFPAGHFSVRPMMLGASIAALSYIGFDAISTLAEDTLNPEKDIGFSTVLVCILQTLICVVTVYFAALAWNNYGAFPHVDTAILDIGHRIGGQVMFLILTFVLLGGRRFQRTHRPGRSFALAVCHGSRWSFFPHHIRLHFSQVWNSHTRYLCHLRRFANRRAYDEFSNRRRAAQLRRLRRIHSRQSFRDPALLHCAEATQHQHHFQKPDLAARRSQCLHLYLA